MMFIETHVCGKWQTSIELQSSKKKQIGRIKDKEDKRKNKRAFMNYNLLGKKIICKVLIIPTIKLLQNISKCKYMLLM